MPVNTSNPLFQDIQQTAEGVKQTYANLPTFQSNMQAGIVGGDAMLNSATDNYTDKVAELFAHDKEVSTNYIKPEDSAFGALPEGMVLDPSSKWKTDNALYAQKGKEAADALNLYEKRKNYLGDLVDKAVKMYEAAAKGKEIDYKTAKDELDAVLKLADQAETKRHNLAMEGDGASSTGSEMVDNLTDEQAIAIAQELGYNFTGGTKAERMAKIRGALAEYDRTGKYNYKYLTEQLSSKENETITALRDVITRSDDLTAALGTGENLTGPIKGRTSGFLAKYFGKTGNASMVGKELEEMSADKIKERYGGALTSTEVQRLTKQAITERNVQEADNLQSLAIMKKNATNILREKLLQAGWTEKQVEGYINNISSSSGGDSRPPLESFDQ